MEVVKRNRAATIQRIVEAVDQLLAEAGLDSLSINAISKKAAVSKVLIYRYFGGLEGLVDYYVRRGELVPQYEPAWLEQIQPRQAQDLAPIWSSQLLQLFRLYRSSPSARELIKATVQENNSISNTISETLDGELTRLVHQLAFVKGANQQGVSAILLGALSYLTIQAQLDHSVIGLDLRSEAGWQQIEEAIKTICRGLNQLAVSSSTTQFNLKPHPIAAVNW